ncbi:concanavalin A-like lectin/glucanase domain-containing protein [Pyronema omphalodes]|nr:concanavalin A-like lectin/glucanase domain-containing protein [Pyronema omphalodes]
MTARLFIQKGASVEPEKEYTAFLLAEAEERDDMEIVGILANACQGEPKVYGRAISTAIRRGYALETINRLLRVGGSPHWRDKYGWSAFDLAIAHQRNDVVSLLQRFASPPGSSPVATKSTGHQKSPMRWCEMESDELNELDVTDFEVTFVSNNSREYWTSARGYRHMLVQGCRPFLFSHTLHSNDNAIPDYDNSTTAISTTNGQPEIYFEITVLATDNDGVGLGLTNGPLQRLDRMPGWDENTWGYHGDDGKTFHNTSHYGWEYIEKYGAGDTVGCGVIKGRLFFTKNGRFLGFRFEDVYGQLFPIVGMAPGNKIRANFGDEHFLWSYDKPCAWSYDQSYGVDRLLKTVRIMLPMIRLRRAVLRRRTAQLLNRD